MDGEKKQLKTRFAPTPSGYLHKGNLFSFVLTWLLARKSHGSILLRIDDIDHQRVREDYLADIFNIIDWLGLDYDEGPFGVGDFEKNFSQLTRLDLYEEALANLEDQPDLTFYCECSRSQIIKISSDGNYPGTCVPKRLGPDRQHSLRIVTPDEASVEFKDTIRGNIKIDISKNMRHFILRKKDGYPSYQLTSVVDDQNFGINTIVRGGDLLDSSVAQMFLANFLNNSSLRQANFYHHPLLTKGTTKLSKSQGDSYLSVDERSPKNLERLIKDFCYWMHYRIQVTTLKELYDLFEMVHLKQLRQTSH